MNESVLVTGGGGFIGRWVVRDASRRGRKVISVDRFKDPGAKDHVALIADEGDDDFWVQCFKEYAPAFIIHLAGASRTQNFKALFEGNILLTHRIIDAVREVDPKMRLVIPDSAASLGVPSGVPVSEDHPCLPVNQYGVTKLCQRLLAESYIERFGLHILFGRIFNITGPGEPKGLVCRDMAEKLMISKGNVHMFQPETTRDFLDVRDVASALLLIAEKGSRGEIYNICSGTETSIRAVSGLVMEAMKKSVECTWSVSDEGNSIDRIAGSNGKLHALGWGQQFGLRESIRDMVTQLMIEKAE